MLLDYAARLEWAMKRCGMKPARLAELLDISLQAVRKVLHGKSKALATENNSRAARILGVDPDWLATGVGSPELGVAHRLIQSARETAPSLSWGDVVKSNGDLPPTFELSLPDDALAPDFARGTVLQWSISKAPAIGSIVIVKDRYGQHHVRQYAEGSRPGHWVAAASGKPYRDYDSADDGLIILAVATGAWRPLR